MTASDIDTVGKSTKAPSAPVATTRSQAARLGRCVFCIYELARTKRRGCPLAPIAVHEVATPNGTRALCEAHAGRAAMPLAKTFVGAQLDLFISNGGR